MAGIFKAYDIRGTYPDQLDETTARNIGLAFQHLLEDPAFAGRPVVVGHDMRSHSEPLVRALIEGLNTAGLDTVNIGLATTPMNYYATGELGAAGGVQVTASHNPAQYNGFKMSRDGARPVSGETGIELMEQCIEQGNLPAAAEPGQNVDRNIFEEYSKRALSYLKSNDAKRLRVVVDAANGMGAVYRPILEAAGIELIPLYFELDGSFPNHEANPLKLENLNDLSEKIQETGADLGVAFDGDADRAAFVDEKGEPIGSDLITALIGGDMLDSNPGGAIVYDIRSSRAVPEYIEARGGRPVRERVGHSFLKATMRSEEAVFAGELAGHYYFRENYCADSSILAVVHVLNLLNQSGKPASEVVEPLRCYAKSPEINFEVEDKQGAMDALVDRYSDGELDRLDGIRIDYADWWFNVRPSNTEPLLRLVLEARDPETRAQKQAELIGLLGEPSDH